VKNDIQLLKETLTYLKCNLKFVKALCPNLIVGSCMTNIGHFRAAGKWLDKMGSGSLSTAKIYTLYMLLNLAKR